MNRDNLADGLTMIRKTKTRLSTKAQIDLPRVAHEEISLKPEIVAKARTWESIIGCVKHEGPRRSVKEMDAAVAAKERSRKRSRRTDAPH
jgi:hypothetical protein